jgi:hypothetical protein
MSKIMSDIEKMRRAVVWAAGVVLAIGLCFAPAAADVRLDLGLRLELLNVDEGLQFSCDCDTETDPDCERVDDPEFCQGAQLDQPYDGYLVGALIGVNGETEYLGAGARLSLGFGSFDPADLPSNYTGPDRSIGLGHVAIEVPLEAHLQLSSLQLYVQVVPRVGVLNYFSDESTEESADTFTFGGLFVVGFRIGNPKGLRVGAAAGRVQHPGFGGWAFEAMVSPNLSGLAEEPADPPLEYESDYEARIERAQELQRNLPDRPVEPPTTTQPVGADGFAEPEPVPESTN